MIRTSANTWKCEWHGGEYLTFLNDELICGLLALMFEALDAELKGITHG